MLACPSGQYVVSPSIREGEILPQNHRPICPEGLNLGDFPTFSVKFRLPHLHRDFRRYKSCLHADGVGEAPPPEEGAAPAAAAPNYVECEMLLGVHTMGQAGRQFTERELDAAKKVATAVGDALERSEKAIWDGEVMKISAEAEKAGTLGETIASAKLAAEAAAGEKVAALAEDMPDYRKDLATKLAAYEGAVAVIKAVTAELGALGTKRMPLQPGPIRLLTGLLYTLGYAKDDFVDAATNKVNWEKMRLCFAGDAADFLSKVDSYKPDAEGISYGKYARVQEIKALVALEEMPSSDPLYSVAILDFVNTATEVRESASECRRAEAEAAAAEAEAEE